MSKEARVPVLEQQITIRRVAQYRLPFAKHKRARRHRTVDERSSILTTSKKHDVKLLVVHIEDGQKFLDIPLNGWRWEVQRLWVKLQVICNAVALRHTTPNAALKKVVEAIYLNIINAGFILRHGSTNKCEIVLENEELVTVDKRPSPINDEIQSQPRVVCDGIAGDGSSKIDVEERSCGDAAVTSSLHGRTTATPEAVKYTCSTSAIKRKRSAAASPVEYPKLPEQASETSKRFLAVLKDGSPKEATVLPATDNTVAGTAEIEQVGQGEAVSDTQARVRRGRCFTSAWSC